MFNSVDSFLMNYAQKFSEKFQKLTGRTCFFLASMCLAVDAAIGFFRLFIIHKDLERIIILFTSLIILVLAVIEYFEDKSFNRKKFDGYVNHLIIAGRSLRFFCLSMCLIFCLVAIISKDYSVNNLLRDSGFVAFTLATYFGSCTPLPPKKSKIREWLEAGQKAFSEVFAPALKPVQVPIRH